MILIDDEFIAKLRTSIAATPSDDGVAHIETSSKECTDCEDDNKDAFSSSQAFQKIVRLVSVRERCASELHARLIRDGFGQDAAELSVRRACECGLVDDMRFAEVYIRSKLSQGRGVVGITNDLRQRGIDIHDVCGWPEEFYPGVDNKSELDRALDVLEHRPSHSKNQMKSAYQKLISRGFDSSVAQSAARKYANRQDIS